jgi:alkyl hydroperoxide reductase subunit AhpF
MLEKLLTEKIAQQVKDVFEQTLQHPVHVLFFGSESRCEYCLPTMSLLEEIIPLSDKLSLEIHDVELEPEIAKIYHVDKTPGIVITAKEKFEIIDYGIRYSGMPSGHEFTSLINDLIMVSQRSTDLNQDTRAFLGTINKNILLQVFVTPT